MISEEIKILLQNSAIEYKRIMTECPHLEIIYDNEYGIKCPDCKRWFTKEEYEYLMDLRK